MEQEKYVAIGLLTQTHLEMLGRSLKKVIPLTEDGRFDAILKALDETEASRSNE